METKSEIAELILALNDNSETVRNKTKQTLLNMNGDIVQN